MRLAECSVGGLSLVRLNKIKGIRKGYLLSLLKILRKKPRHRPVILIGIRHIVGVELELVVIEVEDRGVPELVIRIRSFTTSHPWHKLRNTILQMNHNSVLYLTT